MLPGRRPRHRRGPGADGQVVTRPFGAGGYGAVRIARQLPRCRRPGPARAGRSRRPKCRPSMPPYSINSGRGRLLDSLYADLFRRVLRRPSPRQDTDRAQPIDLGARFSGTATQPSSGTKCSGRLAGSGGSTERRLRGARELRPSSTSVACCRHSDERPASDLPQLSRVYTDPAPVRHAEVGSVDVTNALSGRASRRTDGMNDLAAFQGSPHAGGSNLGSW